MTIIIHARGIIKQNNILHKFNTSDENTSYTNKALYSGALITTTSVVYAITKDTKIFSPNENTINDASTCESDNDEIVIEAIAKNNTQLSPNSKTAIKEDLLTAAKKEKITEVDLLITTKKEKITEEDLLTADKDDDEKILTPNTIKNIMNKIMNKPKDIINDELLLKILKINDEDLFKILKLHCDSHIYNKIHKRYINNKLDTTDNDLIYNSSLKPELKSYISNVINILKNIKSYKQNIQNLLQERQERQKIIEDAHNILKNINKDTDISLYQGILKKYLYKESHVNFNIDGIDGEHQYYKEIVNFINQNWFDLDNNNDIYNYLYLLINDKTKNIANIIKYNYRYDINSKDQVIKIIDLCITILKKHRSYNVDDNTGEIIKHKSEFIKPKLANDIRETQITFMNQDDKLLLVQFLSKISDNLYADLRQSQTNKTCYDLNFQKYYDILRSLYLNQDYQLLHPANHPCSNSGCDGYIDIVKSIQSKIGIIIDNITKYDFSNLKHQNGNAQYINYDIDCSKNDKLLSMLTYKLIDEEPIDNILINQIIRITRLCIIIITNINTSYPYKWFNPFNL